MSRQTDSSMLLHINMINEHNINSLHYYNKNSNINLTWAAINQKCLK